MAGFYTRLAGSNVRTAGGRGDAGNDAQPLPAAPIGPERGGGTREGTAAEGNQGDLACRARWLGRALRETAGTLPVWATTDDRVGWVPAEGEGEWL